jgi:hypothetical protein
MAKGRSRTYAEIKQARLSSEASRPRDPGPRPRDGDPALEPWKDAMRKFVLAPGNLKEFVKRNGRIWEYYAPLHDRICDDYDASSPRIGSQQMPEEHMALFPRGVFKTTIGCDFLACQMLRNPNILMQYIRGSKELAANVLFETRRESLVTNFVIDLWGSIEDEGILKIDSQYALTLGTNKDPTIRCGGIEGSLTGSHMDWAWLDDLVDEENFNSKVLSRNVQAAFAFLRPKLHPKHGNKLVSGTLWPRHTFYDEIMATNERLEKRQLEAIQSGNLEEAESLKHKIWFIDKAGVHSDDGTLLFPGKLDEPFLKLVRENEQTAEYYPGWYEMVPIGGGEKYFPKEDRRWFTGQLYHDPMPHIAITNQAGTVMADVPVDVYMTYDGTLTANAGSDYVGITINAVDAADNWYVLSAKGYKELPSIMTDIVGLQLLVFRPGEMWVEPGCLSGEMMADLQKFILEKELPTVIKDLKLLRKGGAKEKRINALQTRYSKHKILLHAGPWCRDLSSQMDDWTGNAADLDHDDVIDSLSMQSGIAVPCGIEKLSELEEIDDPFDPSWADPGLLGDWQTRPWAGVQLAPGCERSFDGGPSRIAMQMEEASKVMVNMNILHPPEKQEARIGGHAGLSSKRRVL